MGQHTETIAGLVQLLDRFEAAELEFDGDAAMGRGVEWVLENLVEVHLPGPIFDTELEGLARIAGLDLRHPNHREVLAAGATLAQATGAVRLVCRHDRPTAFCDRLRNPDPSWRAAGEKLLAQGSVDESLAVRDAHRQLARPAHRRRRPHPAMPPATDTREGMR